MDQLNDILWNDEDDDIITIQGIMTTPCEMMSDCDLCEPPAPSIWEQTCLQTRTAPMCQ